MTRSQERATLICCLLSRSSQRLVLLKVGAEVLAGCQAHVGAGALQQPCDDAPVTGFFIGAGAAEPDALASFRPAEQVVERIGGHRVRSYLAEEPGDINFLERIFIPFSLTLELSECLEQSRIRGQHREVLNPACAGGFVKPHDGIGRIKCAGAQLTDIAYENHNPTRLSF